MKITVVFFLYIPRLENKLQNTFNQHQYYPEQLYQEHEPSTEINEYEDQN